MTEAQVHVADHALDEAVAREVVNERGDVEDVGLLVAVHVGGGCRGGLARGEGNGRVAAHELTAGVLSAMHAACGFHVADGGIADVSERSYERGVML